MRIVIVWTSLKWRRLRKAQKLLDFRSACTTLAMPKLGGASEKRKNFWLFVRLALTLYHLYNVVIFNHEKTLSLHRFFVWLYVSQRKGGAFAAYATRNHD